jgi:hypothetical protein
VPLPAPGPPRTKITLTLEGEKVGVSFLGAGRWPEVWGASIAGAMSVLGGVMLIEWFLSRHRVEEVVVGELGAVELNWEAWISGYRESDDA